VTPQAEITAFLSFYPLIYYACHRRHVRDQQARKKLSLNQASILDHLDSVEPTNLCSLARHMGVTASTMSLNVDRLERAGYVRRARNRHDARQIELRLTDAGIRLKQQQKLLDAELVGSLLKRLQGPDRTRALSGLELLAEAATEMITARQGNNHRNLTPSDITKKNPL
jgi:DNA-binding MarR family transcriptional regulator